MQLKYTEKTGVSIRGGGSEHKARRKSERANDTCGYPTPEDICTHPDPSANDNFGIEMCSCATITVPNH